MADLTSRDLTLPQPDCEGGGEIEAVAPDYTEIIVIRHGQTEWNANRRIQGQLDVDLNDVGRKQAAAVAGRLSKEPKISAVYSSDLKRAYDTAEMIANCCGVSDVFKDRNLRERHMGDLHGVVFHEAAKIRPEAHKAFLSRSRDQEIPVGGESLNQLSERCISALERIAKKHRGERVIVVTHGATIEELHRRGSNGMSTDYVPNTSVNVFHLFEEDKWSIKSWGDVSHLDGLFGSNGIA
ncbi:phosphoglycerate mutase-like protein 4 [Olea europaea var. sylvestris]|uniref:phosphoglycerate mutase-like protein 4 n=1 Tax=Olea europaea var. sylvestris TaxID=158386 RepID=UPI000C1D87D7|nr:phosphoglycerate mutase-like protein 4 [Olea europaea var. sylvestris]